MLIPLPEAAVGKGYTRFILKKTENWVGSLFQLSRSGIITACTV
jgi:hypothetical protein